jgi:amino acid transporter
MLDAARLVPATRYQRQSRAWVAVVLWLGAFVAPVVALAVVERLREHFEDSTDDVLPVAIGVGSLLLCFVLVWLPIRYHIRQAHRIGAPTNVVAAWFWLPLFAAVGVFTAMWLGMHDLLADNGFTDLERTAQVAVLYGVPATMFALTTWRATTVFDEVIELRWSRWRTEWEQTLIAFASQPPPGPEGSPVIDGRMP